MRRRPSMPRWLWIDVMCDRQVGTWVVKRGGETHTFDTKQEAFDRAVSAARAVGNAQVVIRKTDGTIQSERTYESDPARTRG